MNTIKRSLDYKNFYQHIKRRKTVNDNISVNPSIKFSRNSSDHNPSDHNPKSNEKHETYAPSSSSDETLEEEWIQTVNKIKRLSIGEDRKDKQKKLRRDVDDINDIHQIGDMGNSYYYFQPNSIHSTLSNYKNLITLDKDQYDVESVQKIIESVVELCTMEMQCKLDEQKEAFCNYFDSYMKTDSFSNDKSSNYIS